MAASSIQANDLFDAEFLESLKTLRFIARRVPPGGRFADQRSRDLGSGIEFRDFRPYAAGDDLRAIDWNIYRRLGRVFLRLFEEWEDMPLYILPDTSASMYLEDPPRARAGLRTSLALAAISLNHHDTVGVFPFKDDVKVALRPQAGKRRVLRFAEHLASLEPGGSTDLAAALQHFGKWRMREGLVAVVSDFFDAHGIESVIDALRHVRHKLLLVQLVRKGDREPDVSGDLRLVDCESGEAQDVTVTPTVLARYRDAYDDFQEQLVTFAQKRGAGLLQIDADEPVVPQLAQIFERGSLPV